MSTLARLDSETEGSGTSPCSAGLQLLGKCLKFSEPSGDRIESLWAVQFQCAELLTSHPPWGRVQQEAADTMMFFIRKTVETEVVYLKRDEFSIQ